MKDLLLAGFLAVAVSFGATTYQEYRRGPVWTWTQSPKSTGQIQHWKGTYGTRWSTLIDCSVAADGRRIVGARSYTYEMDGYEGLKMCERDFEWNPPVLH